MDNVVTLGTDRPRPTRLLAVPRGGARILFFTGVRYCRDEDRVEEHDQAEDLAEAEDLTASALSLDLALH